MAVTLSLPLPPPINRMYRFGKGNWYKTKEVRDWEQEAGWMCVGILKTISRKCRIDIHLYLKRDRDIDGSLKILLDLLESMQIIKNDSLVYKLDVEKEFDKDNPHVEITIKEL